MPALPQLDGLRVATGRRSPVDASAETRKSSRERRRGAGQGRHALALAASSPSASSLSRRLFELEGNRAARHGPKAGLAVSTLDLACRHASSRLFLRLLAALLGGAPPPSVRPIARRCQTQQPVSLVPRAYGRPTFPYGLAEIRRSEDTHDVNVEKGRQLLSQKAFVTSGRRRKTRRQIRPSLANRLRHCECLRPWFEHGTE